MHFPRPLHPLKGFSVPSEPAEDRWWRGWYLAGDYCHFLYRWIDWLHRRYYDPHSYNQSSEQLRTALRPLQRTWPWYHSVSNPWRWRFSGQGCPCRNCAAWKLPHQWLRQEGHGLCAPSWLAELHPKEDWNNPGPSPAHRGAHSPYFRTIQW